MALFWKMLIHLGQLGTPHPHHTLPPPSPRVSQLWILRDRCIDHPVLPNAGDNPPICPMKGPGNPVLPQTLVSLCSPGCHCPASAKRLHPSKTMSTKVSGPIHPIVGPISRAGATLGYEMTLAATSIDCSLEQVSCSSGPPPGSLNAACAKCGKLCDRAVPCEVTCIPTHKTVMLLPLVVVHCLCHPQWQFF